MIDFWKDNNRGLPAMMPQAKLKTTSTEVMLRLLNGGFEEVYNAQKMRPYTFFLFGPQQIVVLDSNGFRCVETLCFSGVIRERA